MVEITIDVALAVKLALAFGPFPEQSQRRIRGGAVFT